MIHALTSLFEPSAIAVVGASRDESSVGHAILTNLLRTGFQGQIFPINPHAETLLGKKCFASVLDIKDKIDVAIIAVPAPIVSKVLEEVGQKSIPIAVIISSGFREIGSSGAELENTIVKIAKKQNVHILGPNCLGFIHPFLGINASFARPRPILGNIAFLSQSGAMGAAILDITTPKGVGFSHFISIGNRADITELDLMEYLITDENTKVIGLYVEQLTDAKCFISICQKLSRLTPPKPVVVLKAGKTKEGRSAVHSHTGSLAGDTSAYHALFRQANAIETYTTQDFVNTLVCAIENPLPKGNNTLVITNAGGPAILATDILIQKGVYVKTGSSHKNPRDLLGDASSLLYKKALDEAKNDDNVHSICTLVTPQTMTEVEQTATVLALTKKGLKKPLTVAWMGEGVMKNGKKILDEGEVPYSKYPESAATMLGNLHTYAKRIRCEAPVDKQRIRHKGATKSIMDPYVLCSSYEIPLPPHMVYKSVDAITTPHHLSDSLAIKILSPDIIHKTEDGAVALHVLKKDAQNKAAHMISDIKKNHPEWRIQGILFMDMIDISEALEMIVGFKKEPDLGELIMVGLGGTYVEFIRDISFGFAPLSFFEAQRMIDDLRAKILLKGYRGKPKLDTDALIQTLLQVAKMTMEHPEIKEFEVNPLVVLPKGVMALDARLVSH